MNRSGMPPLSLLSSCIIVRPLSRISPDMSILALCQMPDKQLGKLGMTSGQIPGRQWEASESRSDTVGIHT
jgi:hypothetical protein